MTMKPDGLVRFYGGDRLGDLYSLILFIGVFSLLLWLFRVFGRT